jgi:hypothetical protein
MSRPIAERIQEAEDKAATCLITARNLEHKNPERAEVWFDRSAKWLMEANRLGSRGNGYGVTHPQT